MMAEACVKARIYAPAAQVWHFLRWDNLEAMLPSGLFAAVRYHERRPVSGATRTVSMPDDRLVQERLESQSEQDFSMRYRVLNSVDFQLAEYLGEARVTPVGAGECLLCFSCAFTPLGISADEWRTFYAAMQHAHIAFIRSSVEQKST